MMWKFKTQVNILQLLNLLQNLKDRRESLKLALKAHFVLFKTELFPVDIIPHLPPMMEFMGSTVLEGFNWGLKTFDCVSAIMVM
jgi:hypothetical protein